MLPLSLVPMGFPDARRMEFVARVGHLPTGQTNAIPIVQWVAGTMQGILGRGQIQNTMENGQALLGNGAFAADGAADNARNDDTANDTSNDDKEARYDNKETNVDAEVDTKSNSDAIHDKSISREWLVTVDQLEQVLANMRRRHSISRANVLKELPNESGLASRTAKLWHGPMSARQTLTLGHLEWLGRV